MSSLVGFIVGLLVGCLFGASLTYNIHEGKCKKCPYKNWGIRKLPHCVMKINMV